jgi:Zn-dependent peptidase ImmA (M78 family)
MMWAMAGIHSNRGAKRAREARAAAGLDPAARLECVLTVVEERFELPVVIAALSDDVAGACYRNGDFTLLWVNGDQAKPRQRFTLAHELGHTWCEHDGTLDVDTFQTLSGATTTPFEIQANAFAAEFLLPKVAVQGRFVREPGLDEVVTLAAEYGVSAIAALIRLTTAGILGPAREQRIREEIQADDHLEAYDRLDLPRLEDRIQAVDALPYTSPALADTALGAARRGDVPVAAAAHAAGVEPEQLGAAIETITAPGPA